MHCLMYSALMFYAKGRVIIPCTLLAKGARAIGREHFHLLFHFPITKGTAQCLAENAVMGILRTPCAVEILMMINALTLNESGTLPSALFSALDIVMQHVRGSSTWMGGLLIITTINDKQLHPIEGYPMLLSPHILTCFRVAILSESIRCAKDANQQCVIKISRNEQSSNDDDGREQEYLLFSIDANLQTLDEDDGEPTTRTQRFYFQARQDKDSRSKSISLVDDTVMIKQDVVQQSSRIALFSPTGIFAQFRYIGDFIAKPYSSTTPKS